MIRFEMPADRQRIQNVNRLAFGREDEARLVDALREGGYFRVSLVSESGGEVVGHILFSDLPIISGGHTSAALALAPLAVLPEHQRRGLGSQLVRRGLDICRERGHRIVVVLGEPDFYRRFGFSSELGARLDSPFPGNASLMALELVEGSLDSASGRVRYPPPFGLA